LASTFTGLLFTELFMVDDGECVFSIAFDSVDFGVGSFAGPPCNVVGRTGVLVIITGFFAPVFTLLSVAWAGVLTCPCVFAGRGFFPNLTDAGRGLVFFTPGLAAIVVFFAVLVLTCVIFAAGFAAGFEVVFAGIIVNPITGTATNPIVATAAHFIQLVMTTPLPKPISKFAPHQNLHGSWLRRWGCSAALHARPPLDYRATRHNPSNIVAFDAIPRA